MRGRPALAGGLSRPVVGATAAGDRRWPASAIERVSGKVLGVVQRAGERFGSPCCPLRAGTLGKVRGQSPACGRGREQHSMADSDYLVDRRRLKRKVGFWRVAAFVVALVAIIGAALACGSRTVGSRARAHIAKVEISGFIIGRRQDARPAEAGRREPRRAAVLVEINSPGGTVTGSEILFDGLARAVGEEADRRRRQRPRRLGRLHRGHGHGAHRRPADLAGRFDRRAVPVAERRRASSKSSGVDMES